MNKICILILIAFLGISCSTKQEKKSDTGSQEVTKELSSGLDYKQPQKIKKSKREPRIKALFTANPDALKLADLNKVTNVFNDITAITFQMIDASSSKQDKLVKKANRIVHRYGYKDLQDYGAHLEVYTWAAGTYLKLQSIDEVHANNTQSRIARVMEESLKNRLKKQRISERDLELIRANWYKIDKVLKTMEEMTSAADKKEENRYK